MKNNISDRMVGAGHRAARSDADGPVGSALRADRNRSSTQFSVLRGLRTAEDSRPYRLVWLVGLLSFSLFANTPAFAQFYGYDLPTDAEWEKAARGPEHDDQDEHLLFPWGNVIDGSCAAISGVRMPVGYFDGNQTPIGSDMVNGFGLYDVVGNVMLLSGHVPNMGIRLKYMKHENL